MYRVKVKGIKKGEFEMWKYMIVAELEDGYEYIGVTDSLINASKFYRTRENAVIIETEYVDAEE